jgi:HEAT repeat protein
MKKLLLICLVAAAAGCGGKQDTKDYSVPALIADLKAADPDTRYTAANVLGKYGPEARSAVPALTEALRDPNKNVRAGAAYALAEIGADALSAQPALKSATRDGDKDVRDAAAYALRQLQGKR